MQYTKTELRFKELHKQLLDLKLYDLASNFSTTFYNYGSENYKQGAAMVNEIRNQ